MTEYEQGRPTDYDSKRHDRWVQSMCRLGMTNEEMAEHMGISVATFYNWQKKFPSFLEAIKEGKSESDSMVVAALFERAIGKTYVESEVVKDGSGEIVKTKHIKKNVPPDINAVRMWLFNRDPHRWVDKTQTELSGPNGAPIKAEVSVSLTDKLSKYKDLFNDESNQQ